MTETRAMEPSGEEGKEFYSINDSQAQQEYVEVRRAAKWVNFFIPHLRPGMTVLDCGCGVGSITLDLAELVAPGQVIGIDMDEKQLSVARSKAEQRQIHNVQFEVGDVYHLKYASASFDAVLAHTLLVHLSDQLGALAEIRRVLKAGGVAGVSDDDLSTVTFAPADPLVKKAFDIWIRLIELNGGAPFYSRNLRGLMRQAGFVKTEGHAVAADYYGTLEETRRFGRIAGRLLHDPALVEIMIGQGLTNQAELESIRAAVSAWSENPDAFLATMYYAAVGWV